MEALQAVEAIDSLVDQSRVLDLRINHYFTFVPGEHVGPWSTTCPLAKSNEGGGCSKEIKPQAKRGIRNFQQMYFIDGMKRQQRRHSHDQCSRGHVRIVILGGI